VRFEAAATFVEPVLNTATSATGVMEVVACELTDEPLLLDGFGSAVPEVAEAELVIEPLAGAVTVTVNVVDAPLARLAMVGQVTTPRLFVPPPEAETKVTAAGKLSVTTMLVAVEGPLLVTVMV